MAAAQVGAAFAPGGYGISDGSQAFLAYADSCGFRAITVAGCPATAHHGPLALVRLYIPYDAVGYYDERRGACDWSPALVAGGEGRRPDGIPTAARAPAQDWDALVAALRAATADGLTPEVAIDNGTGIGAPGEPVPSLPDPTYGTSENPHFSYTEAGRDYACGVYYLMYLLWRCAGPANGCSGGSDYTFPTRYEAWNEPDGATTALSAGGGFNGALPGACTSDAGDCGPRNGTDYDQNGYLCGAAFLAPDGERGECGQLEAAELWNLMQAGAASLFGTFAAQGFPMPQVAALSLSGAQLTGWEMAYLDQVERELALRPSVWAVHDYEDPTSTVGTADLQAFEDLLAARDPAPAEVWVTEAAVRLDDPVQRDQNIARPPCLPPGAVPPRQTIGRSRSGTLTTRAKGFGLCVDGNPAAQAAGARIWQRLLDVRGGANVVTREVFWYQYATPGRLHSWDSALTDASGSPRASLCVLYGPGCRPTGIPRDYENAYWDTYPPDIPSGYTQGCWIPDTPGLTPQCY